jgi:corrinoid protein of di/trimethylamine methyltransferase
MTHKQRMYLTIKGEQADQLPYVPRIDMWYNANSWAGTLPEKHRGRTQDEISRAEGWALHKVLADLLDQGSGGDVLHRGIGIYATRQAGYRYKFSSKVDVRVSHQGDSTRIEYHTPVGMVSTLTTFTEDLRKAGSTIPFMGEYAIKKVEDYRVLAYIFENLELIPAFDDWLEWQAGVGEDGVCSASITPAASPMHHIQREFLDPTSFYFHYHDHQREMDRLAEAMKPYFDQLLRMAIDCPAELIFWGANYDDMITYPPFFEKEILPWLQKTCEILHGQGKMVHTHCDGENLGLMDLIRNSGIDMAEAICPYPMTKVRIEEYYQKWGDHLTIFGGIPSNMLLADLATNEEFEAYLDHLFKAIVPGTRFIVGIADTTPPKAAFDRLVRIGERVAKEGRLPLRVRAGAVQRIARPQLAEPAVRMKPPTAGDERFRKIREVVFQGDEAAMPGHIQELIKQGLAAQDIIDHGLIAAMEIIGRKFKAGELFIPEVLLSARALNQGLAALEPYLSAGLRPARAKVLIGTVKGDLHDIGKNLVATMWRGVGFDVVDLGIDVKVEDFLAAVRSDHPEILGLSALLTTTMPEMKRVIEELRKAGLREQVKVIIGGAPVNAQYAQAIGADGYAPDASEAVELVHRLSGK